MVPEPGFDQPIQRVLRSGCTVLHAGSVNVALRGHHRVVSKKLHQRVHADVPVGEFGGVGYLNLFARKRL